jgi:hypothetical protein
MTRPGGGLNHRPDLYRTFGHQYRQGRAWRQPGRRRSARWRHGRSRDLYSRSVHYGDMPGGQHKDRFDSATWCRAKAATLRVQAEHGANAAARARASEIVAEWEAKADALDRPASVTAGSSNRPRLGERTLLQLRYAAAGCRMLYLANYWR